MVSVVKRPVGHKLIDQAIAATIVESYEGDALVEFPYHSLSTGATVYIESDIDEYNGFWYVTVATPNTFKISEYEGAPFVEFYQEADIDYYQTQEHDWSSILLPIVYKITNDKWPVNSVDPLRTISSAADDNGFTFLTLSGAVRGSVNALEFVRIAGATDTDLNAVWQVVEVTGNNLTISLPYSSVNSFAGATVQYYYNNFQVQIKIFAGLPASHPWEHKKPYEEMAELSLTPDENNEVMFSISDYIQSKAKIENNLTLFSLPLNLDAFTGFYISTGESYDDSDNYSLGTTGVLYMDDSFEGYALTGKLPFKNLYSGDYAQYVYTSGSPAKWLTSFERPLGVEGYFFDISFIKNIDGAFKIFINKYLSDYAITEQIAFQDFGHGVYRIPLTLDSAYDSFCITAVADSRTEQVTVDPDPEDFSTYGQIALGPPEVCAVSWVITDVLTITDLLDACNANFVGRARATANGTVLKVNYDILVSFNNTHPPPVIIQFYFILSETLGGFQNLNILTYDVPVVGSGSAHLVGSINVTATADREFFSIWVDTGADEADVTVNSISFGESTTEEVEVPAITMTEEICIDILEACEVENGFISEGRRLTEDGGFRLLE